MELPKTLDELEALGADEIKLLDSQAEWDDFPKVITATVCDRRFVPDGVGLLAGNTMYTTYLSGSRVVARYQTPFGGVIDRSLSEALRDFYTHG